jgi:plasmid stability protein
VHRTQLLIEEWQYDALRVRAERRAISISELVREILAKYLEANDRPSGVYRLEGLGSDASSSAREHDAFLYGKKRR